MTTIMVTGSGTHLDAKDVGSRVNQLPEHCNVCHFPEIQFIPKPYKLIDARTKNPNDLSLAELGNLLVRPRAKEILDAVVPGQCIFYPTIGAKTGEVTPWFLAVPVNTIYMGQAKTNIPRCPACGEPKSAHWGSQFDYAESPPQLGENIEIAKSTCWGSLQHPWDATWKESDWIYRHLMTTVRFYHLLKGSKLKGAYEATSTSEAKPSAEDRSWIAEKMQLLAELGLSTNPTEPANKPQPKNRKLTARPPLPALYHEFVKRNHSVSYSNIDEHDGFTVRILPTEEIDYVNYRKGKLFADDDGSNAVDGVMFAIADHGDCFCFDFAAGDQDPPIVLYLHEGHYFEPYAANFAECISRFEAAK